VIQKPQKWPTLSQWRQLPSLLSQTEKVLLSLFIVLFSGSLFFLLNGFYTTNTHIVAASGGEIVEGIVGSPRFINPVYAESNDADRDLVELIFSGLLKYDGKGKLVADLAKNIQTEQANTSFVIDLREDVQWHDGRPFTADDVVFTIKTIQDPKFKSPIRANWIGVEVEKISDFRIRLRLSEPYAPFLSNLTVKILPSHLWQEVGPENFALNTLNLQPIGTGPFEFVNLEQNRSGTINKIILKAYNKYYVKTPFIQNITLHFFDTQEELTKRLGNLNAFALSAPERIPSMFSLHSFSLPRYFALFYNLDKGLDKNIREALISATDRQTLSNELLGTHGRAVSSPLLPDIFGFNEPANTRETDRERATIFLENAGYEKIDGKFIKTTVQLDGEFRVQLKKGSQGQEVRSLQACLAEDPDVYPEAQVSGVFGPLTEKAVTRFQEKYSDDVLTPSGLTKGTGVVGPSTRAKLNEICFSQEQESTPLHITISTVNQFPLEETAQLLKKQWEEFGVETEIIIYSPSELERDVIKSRNYELCSFFFINFFSCFFQ